MRVTFSTSSSDNLLPWSEVPWRNVFSEMSGIGGGETAFCLSSSPPKSLTCLSRLLTCIQTRTEQQSPSTHTPTTHQMTSITQKKKPLILSHQYKQFQNNRLSVHFFLLVLAICGRDLLREILGAIQTHPSLDRSCSPWIARSKCRMSIQS